MHARRIDRRRTEQEADLLAFLPGRVPNSPACCCWSKSFVSSIASYSLVVDKASIMDAVFAFLCCRFVGHCEIQSDLACGWHVSHVRRRIEKKPCRHGHVVMLNSPSTRITAFSSSFMAEAHQAHLALLGRRDLPPSGHISFACFSRWKNEKAKRMAGFFSASRQPADPTPSCFHYAAGPNSRTPAPVRGIARS
jgi:hypothetical protein